MQNVDNVKVGTEIVFPDCPANRRLYDVTIGKIYTIAGIDEDGEPFFLDDVEEQNFAFGKYGNGVAAIIIE